MIKVVIAGGQSGVDLAGWASAKRISIPTFGYMPRGFKTEYGPRPEYAVEFGAVEHESTDYPPRTLANAKEASLTIWIGGGDSRGYACTRRCVKEVGAEFIEVRSPIDPTPDEIARLIRDGGHERINIAGPRESSKPGIGARAEKYLLEVFEMANAHVPDEESRCKA